MPWTDFLNPFRVVVTFRLSEPCHRKRKFKLGTTTIFFEGNLHVQMTLPDNMVLPGVAPTTGLDHLGNPTPLSGPMTVAVSDPTVVLLTQPDPDPSANGDPNSFTLTWIGALGSAQVTFADPADGIPDIVVDLLGVVGPPVSAAQPVFGPLRPIAP